MDAADVKAIATELGADLVGIAGAETLNAFPPDPRWPQTPERISPHCKSVIVIVCRIPVAAFRAKSNVAVQYMDMMVLRRMDVIAHRLAEALEREGHPSFVTAAQETDWDYKNASYGRLSTRHLGIEAGLGTFGLEVNILTPEFGPRIYLTGILTELELEPDERITELVRGHFDLRPYGILRMLDLLNAEKIKYLKTAAYGHFGREPGDDGSFSWERTDLVDALQSALT